LVTLPASCSPPSKIGWVGGGIGSGWGWVKLTSKDGGMIMGA
jgi:hypothetical protein